MAVSLPASGRNRLLCRGRDGLERGERAKSAGISGLFEIVRLYRRALKIQLLTFCAAGLVTPLISLNLVIRREAGYDKIYDILSCNRRLRKFQ